MAETETIIPNSNPHHLRNIPTQIKETIGLLVNGIAVVGDSHKRMAMTSSLISLMMAALRDYYTSNVPSDIEQTILESIIIMMKLVDEKKRPDINWLVQEIRTYLYEHIKNKEKIPFFLQLLHDTMIIKQARKTWVKANSECLTPQNPNAWSMADDEMSEIHDELYEICIRYNLIIMPKQWQYNLERFDPLSQQLDREEREHGEAV